MLLSPFHPEKAYPAAAVADIFIESFRYVISGTSPGTVVPPLEGDERVMIAQLLMMKFATWETS